MDAALAAIRDQRKSRIERPKPTKRAAPTTTPAHADAINAEDQEIKREMERVLGTPVSLARTGKDLRVTIVFHTDEKLQEFFDLLNAT
jgi:ParB family chromosome partitioning protein